MFWKLPKITQKYTSILKFMSSCQLTNLLTILFVCRFIFYCLYSPVYICKLSYCNKRNNVSYTRRTNWELLLPNLYKYAGFWRFVFMRLRAQSRSLYGQNFFYCDKLSTLLGKWAEIDVRGGDHRGTHPPPSIIYDGGRKWSRLPVFCNKCVQLAQVIVDVIYHVSLSLLA